MNELYLLGKWLFIFAVLITLLTIFLPWEWRGTNAAETTRELAGAALSLMIVSLLIGLIGLGILR